MLKKTILFFISLNIFILSFTSCKSNSEDIIVSSDSMKVIQIASACPLSGELEIGGKSLKNGAQLAIDNKIEVFKKLGFDLKYLPFDDKSDPDVAVDLAEKIVKNKDILAIMGHYTSGVTLETMKLYNDNNLAMITPSATSVEITKKGYKSVNRIVAKDDAQGAVAANFSFDELNAKKTFLMNDGSEYGKGITNEFKKSYKKLGGTITNTISIKEGQEDFSNELNMVKNDNPDVLYFGGLYPEAINIIKGLKKANISAKFISADGTDTPEIVKNVGEGVVDSYYTSTAGNISDTNIGKVWLSRFQNKFNEDPGNYTVYGYDTMDVILNAILELIMEDSNKIPTRKKVSEYIRKTKSFKGLSSNVTFDKNGDNKEAYIFMYKYDEAKYPAKLEKKLKINEIK